jgi:hypothetical protein
MAESLAQASKELNWELHVSSMNDLDEDDILDLSNSILLLSPTTLLVGMISPTNINIDNLNDIFNPLFPPVGYSGYSLIIDPDIPDQFLSNFLELNYHDILDRVDEFKKIDVSKLAIYSFKSEKSVEFKISSKFVHLPFIVDLDSGARHIFFPSPIIAAKIKEDSMEGILEINHVISPYSDDHILIEPFGRISPTKSIQIRIEAGEIVEITGNSILCERLKAHIFELEPDDRKIDKISIGYGLNPTQETGIAVLDRLLNGYISFGLIEDRFEFVIKGVELKTI